MEIYLLTTIIAATFIFFAIVAIYCFVTHNRLVALDERCNSAYSDIDVLLKHRHTVIPGLVEIIRKFVDIENSTVESVIAARKEALRATNIGLRLKAEAKLTDSINTLLSATDKYPPLKSEAHFIRLREELLDVEERITASRRFHNLTIDEFNSKMRQFPGSLFASKLGLQRRSGFDLGNERIFMEERVEMKF